MTPYYITSLTWPLEELWLANLAHLTCVLSEFQYISAWGERCEHYFSFCHFFFSFSSYHFFRVLSTRIFLRLENCLSYKAMKALNLKLFFLSLFFFFFFAVFLILVGLEASSSGANGKAVLSLDIWLHILIILFYPTLTNWRYVQRRMRGAQNTEQQNGVVGSTDTAWKRKNTLLLLSRGKPFFLLRMRHLLFR